MIRLEGIPIVLARLMEARKSYIRNTPRRPRRTNKEKP
jgi:hypothetical protein